MNKKLIAFSSTLIFYLCVGITPALAQSYSIKGHLSNLPSDLSTNEIHLAYYFGDKQYIKETTQISANGHFTFSGDSLLKEGFYMVVMPFQNMNYFDLLISPKEQNFSFTADANSTVSSIEFKKSKENARFYEYLNYLEAKRVEFAPLIQEMERLQESGSNIGNVESKMKAINQEIIEYQNEYIEDNEGSLSAAVIMAGKETESPIFEEDDSVEEQTRKFYLYRQHFYDYINLGDDRLIRTPLIFQKVDEYVVGNNYGIPDSISKAIDISLAQMDPSGETFKFFLVHYLNKYAKSKIVGMDAVYVHLALEYYAKGLAPWSTDEELQKIISNGQKLEPLLIGKKAPNLHMQDRNGRDLSLYEVEADYTVLYFWRYDCDVCTESLPEMLDFHEEFKNQGVKIFAVCTKYSDEVPACWDYVENNKMGEWVNVVDPLGKSMFNMIYDVQITPQIYVLDKDKKILSKRIGTEQLPEVMRQLMAIER